MIKQIFIGYDPREAAAFAACRYSIKKHLSEPIPIHGIVLNSLRKKGLYERLTVHQDGELWDVLSGAPMSTEFAISRFFTPMLARTGWALFMDCDFLVRTDLSMLFDMVSQQYAVYCVKHDHIPEGITKMDGMTQTKYHRKNWSSFMLFNCDHPSNEKLTLNKLNKWPGRDLHAFKWLQDEEIGELGPEWNYLINVTQASVNPKCVHFTLGTPDMPGYDRQPYAEEWTNTLEDWARIG